jgi:hypothetical protein
LGHRAERLCAEGRGKRDKNVHTSLPPSWHRTCWSETVHGIGPPRGAHASAHAKTILGEVAAGKDPAKERSPANFAITIAQLVDVCIAEHASPKRKPRTAADYTALLHNHLVPRFGKRGADQITSSDISQLHLSLRDTPYQANRLVAVVASMYAFAVRQGIVQRGTNPAQSIERFREFARSAISESKS